MVQGLASYCLIKHHFWNVGDEWNMSAAAIFTLSVNASNTQEDGTSPGDTCSALQQSTPLLNLKYVSRFISTCEDLWHCHFAVWIFLVLSGGGGGASEISVESLPFPRLLRCRRCSQQPHAPEIRQSQAYQVHFQRFASSVAGFCIVQFSGCY